MKDFSRYKYIFSDFDGTISKHDVINAFITGFSKSDDPSVSEQLWREGKISTEECLKIQFGMIKGLKRSTFDEFINSIQIDPYFVEFYKFAVKSGKKIVILSDGFDIFIESTLKRCGLADIEVFSNHLIVGEKDGFLTFEMEYPNRFNACKIGSGTCKCAIARKYAHDFIYIGDGLSDRCIARQAGVLFAKHALAEFCGKENISHFKFETFKDIISNIA